MQVITPTLSSLPISSFEYAHSLSPVTAIDAITEMQTELMDAFLRFNNHVNSPESTQIRAQIYLQLAVYAEIENEIFYPAIKHALAEKHLLPELQMTFDPLIELVKQLDFHHPDHRLHEQNIVDLEKYLTHYINAQRNEMFVKAEKLEINTYELGALIRMRRAELMMAISYVSVGR